MTDDAPLGRIGRYELLTRLGSGGMGEVFLARITGTAGFEKQVVIKRMLPHLAGNATFVNRFLDEGRLVVQLRHACIAQVLDMGSDKGVIFLAMEHVDGRDLRELMRLARAAGSPVPPEVAVGILVRILEALDYAHHITDAEGKSLDIIHRDVSPSNVMISRTGEVKLVDFGIARATDRLGTSVSGAVQGKYGYMSPQQAAGGALDARSDLWSVGIVAWELITGRRPFDGDTDLETLDRIRHLDQGSVATVAPDVPEEVAHAVDRLLQKDPEERFADAGQTARALQAYLFRTEVIVGAREIAAWIASCLETLPPDKRARPGASLSLDDALRLNLAGPAASPPGAAPGTVSVATGLPLTPSQGFEGIVPTPTHPPITNPDQPVSVTDVNVPSGRGRWLTILVALNLTLLTAVGVLVLELTSTPEITPESLAESPVARQREEPAPAPPTVPRPPPAKPAAPAPPVPVDPTPLAPVATPSPTEAAPAPVERLAAVPSASKRKGAKAEKKEGAKAEKRRVRLTVQTSPPRATVRIKGHGTGSAPRKIDARVGARFTVKVSAPGHQPKQVPVVLTADKTVKVTLSPVQMGTLSFRYFPASATVRVDGKTVSTSGSNRVQVSLPVGQHRLVLTDGERRHAKAFEIRPDRTTNLATITLGP